MRPNDIAVVGMPLRKQRLDERLLGAPVGAILDTLAALVSYDILLIGQSCLIDLLEQITHAIGLKPQRELELIGRHRLEIVGAVVTVVPFKSLAPAASSKRMWESSGTCFELWNIMCSKRWANPVRPGSSLTGPTWYHRLTDTIGNRAFWLRITSRPFGSVYFSNGRRGDTLGRCRALPTLRRDTHGGECAGEHDGQQ